MSADNTNRADRVAGGFRDISLEAQAAMARERRAARSRAKGVQFIGLLGAASEAMQRLSLAGQYDEVREVQDQLEASLRDASAQCLAIGLEQSRACVLRGSVTYSLLTEVIARLKNGGACRED